MEPRAWVGMNLGRSLTSPGAYSVYVPSVPRVVVTSEVYFDENTFPWKATTPVTATPVASLPTDSGADQPPGLPTVPPPACVESQIHKMPRDVPEKRRPAL
eukprot:6127857-Pleurochrysis_carterae.AAC.1